MIKAENVAVDKELDEWRDVSQSCSSQSRWRMWRFCRSKEWDNQMILRRCTIFDFV